MNKLSWKERIGEITAVSLGAFGTIGCFLSTFPMVYYRLALLIGLVAFGACFYYAYTKQTRKKWLLCLWLIYAIAAIISYPLWKNALAYIINTILRVYESNSQYRFRDFTVSISVNAIKLPVTVALLVIFIPMTALMIRTIRCKHSYFLAFFITLPFIGSILLFTLRPDTWYFSSLLLYDFILYGMSNTGKHSKNIGYLHNGFVLGLCALIVMSALRLGFEENTYKRSEYVEGIRSRIQLAIRDMLQGKQAGKESGELNLAQEGNRIYIYSDDLKVEMENAQSLYLHGYSASIYQDNQWKQMSDERFRLLYDIQGRLTVHPFAFVRDSARNLLEEKRLKQVTVTNQYADDRYLYVPYYVNDDLSAMPIVLDAYISGENSESTYTYHIWGADDLSKLPVSDAVEQYKKHFQETYLQIPGTMRNDLSKIAIPGMDTANTREEKIAAIQSYMLNFGTYTLTPGTTPEGEDFVLYFLQRSERGYCVHYASAAVLLLRTYGIEARYASGYYVSATRFKDGIAIVQDTQAHAWVEILDPIKGWTVLEVTPPSSQSGSQNPSNPSQTTQGNGSGNANQGNANPNQEAQTQPGNPTQPTQTSPASNIPLSWGFVLLILLLLPIRRYVVVYHRRKQMQNENAAKAILACGDTLARLGMTSAQMDPSIRRIWEEARFSTHTMKVEQKEQMLAYCKQIKLQKRKEYRILRRLYERYITCNL